MIPCTIWPSSIVLSSFILSNSLTLCPENILDLSAGLGLTTISAYKRWNCNITATDVHDILTTLSNNCTLNNAIVNVKALQWGDLKTLDELGTFDLIIASDVFYNVDDFFSVIETISFALHKGKGVCLLAHQERGSEETIELEMDEFNLAYEILLDQVAEQGVTVFMIKVKEEGL